MEIDLMKQRERVAELRRHLPPGPATQDYAFEEGPADLSDGDTPTRTIRLSGLFSGVDRPLVIYHLMYGKRQTKPCPMCTAWIDGMNGVAQHVAQNIDFVIAAAAELPALRAHGRDRGRNRLRLLSAAHSTFKYDFGSEDREGNQDSTISVFTRDGDGVVYYFYSAHPWISPEIKERGIDLMSPIWHLLDLTPRGRGNWYTKLEYPSKAHG